MTRATPGPARGRIVDTLERIGQLDNTLIIVVSDNGYGPGPAIVWSSFPVAFILTRSR
jgi:hypothetical protein